MVCPTDGQSVHSRWWHVHCGAGNFYQRQYVHNARFIYLSLCGCLEWNRIHHSKGL